MVEKFPYITPQCRLYLNIFTVFWLKIACFLKNNKPCLLIRSIHVLNISSCILGFGFDSVTLLYHSTSNRRVYVRVKHTDQDKKLQQQHHHLLLTVAIPFFRLTTAIKVPYFRFYSVLLCDLSLQEISSVKRCIRNVWNLWHHNSPFYLLSNMEIV